MSDALIDPRGPQSAPPKNQPSSASRLDDKSSPPSNDPGAAGREPTDATASDVRTPVGVRKPVSLAKTKTMKAPKIGDAKKKRMTAHTGGGRSRSKALNPLRHAIFLQEPVIPGVESKRELRRFRSKVLEALAPQNELERGFAKQIADLSWRRRRVPAYEAAVIARDQEAAEMKAAEVVGRAGQATPFDPLEPGVLKRVLRIARTSLKLLRRLSDLPAEKRIRSGTAQEVLWFVANVAGGRLEDVVDLSVDLSATLENPQSILGHPLLRDWTPAEILEVITQIAARTGKEPADLRLAAVRHLVAVVNEGKSEARSVARAFAARDFHRQLHLLPEAAELDKIVRYEAHLSRQMTVALHEYEALQARRQGGRVPLARLDIQGLD